MTDTEQLIIATMFYYPETIPDIGITSEMFTGAPARELFDAIVVLQATGQELTFPHLGAKVAPKTLSVFMAVDDPPTSELLKGAVRKLKQAHAMRGITDLSARIQDAVQRGYDTAELVAELHKLQSAIPDSLTIYGVEGLIRQGQVLLFFDKRSAQLSEKVLTDLIPIATTSNIKKLNKLNLSVFQGRKVIIWRGEHREAGDHLYHLLTKSGAAGVRVIRNPSGQAAGFGIVEAVDAGWDARQIFAYIRANLTDPAKDEEEPARGDTGERPYTPSDDDPLPDHESAPFQCLGLDHNVFFYLPHGSNQVIPLRADQHSQSHLVTLAPLNWWEAQYPCKTGANWGSASNALIRFQERKGVYDPSRLRGRGAWEDAGRSILHLGNVIYVNGTPQPPAKVETRYIYEAAAPMEYDTPCTPLNATDANKFIALCDKLLWERPIYARLMAGWCIIAPICGALKWRPHVHLSGAAGAGKSWVLKNVVSLAVGPAALSVVGNTTAAAIRQQLNSDARPVIHDEFEAEDQAAIKRIQEELELARACSSDSEAVTLKGGADGKAKVYRTRAAFCFSSIGVNMQQHADVSRVTVLSLQKDPLMTEKQRVAHFDELMALWTSIMTEEYCCALRARTVHLIPVIRRNAEVFARAAAAGVGTQRTGDQLGALLAGAYSLYSSNEITLEAALTWIDSQDWSEYRVKDEQLDESRCLAKILETVLRVTGSKACYELNVGELIHIANGGSHEGIGTDTAESTLKRHGIRVDIYGNTVSISNTHDALKKWLEKTPWANNWRQYLARMPGAVKTDTMRFSPGSPGSKAVQLPLTLLGEG